MSKYPLHIRIVVYLKYRYFKTKKRKQWYTKKEIQKWFDDNITKELSKLRNSNIIRCRRKGRKEQYQYRCVIPYLIRECKRCGKYCQGTRCWECYAYNSKGNLTRKARWKRSKV